MGFITSEPVWVDPHDGEQPEDDGRNRHELRPEAQDRRPFHRGVPDRRLRQEPLFRLPVERLLEVDDHDDRGLDGRPEERRRLIGYALAGLLEVRRRMMTWRPAILLGIGLAVLTACKGKPASPPPSSSAEEATAATGTEKTYELRGKIVSRDAAARTVTVDHERVEGLWEPMTMAFEVRGSDVEALPAVGTRIRATLHVESGRHWLTDVRPE